MGSLTKAVLTLAVLGAAGVAAGRYYPPLRLFAFKAAGRGPACPMDHALKANANEKLQLQYKDRILYASKLIQKDPAGYHLWETPHGRWWIPEGDDFMLPFNLAEQQRRIYGTGDQAVKRGDIVLDCGANVGVFTRVALDAGAAKVVAIEPAPGSRAQRRARRQLIPPPWSAPDAELDAGSQERDTAEAPTAGELFPPE